MPDQENFAALDNLTEEMSTAWALAYTGVDVAQNLERYNRAWAKALFLKMGGIRSTEDRTQ
jgi:hypothetical protein